MFEEPRVSIEQLQKLSPEAQKRFSEWFAKSPIPDYSPYYIELSELGYVLPRFTIGELFTCFESLHPKHANFKYLFAMADIPTTQSILNYLWDMLVIVLEGLPQKFLDELSQANKQMTMQELAEYAEKFMQERHP